MNKLICICLFSFLSSIVSAEESQPSKNVEKINPVYRKTGGMIQRPGVKPGRIVIFNMQQLVATNDISGTARRLSTFFHVEMPIMLLGGRYDKGHMLEVIKKESADFALFLIDDKTDHCSLAVFPDQHFAVVNVAELKSDNGTRAFLVARTCKQMVRAMLTLCGGASSQSVGNLMDPIGCVRDLDKIDVDAIPVDVVSRVSRYLPMAGCNTRTVVPYRVAVAEGWAPPPTNDVQRSIWNRIKAAKERGPTNPIKIAPPAKK